MWLELNHPNILMLQGFVREKDRLCPSIVTEWMDNGSLECYLKNWQNADKLSLVCVMSVIIVIFSLLIKVQVMGITDRLHYLHNNNIVHADLKSVRCLHTFERRRWFKLIIK